MTSLSPYIVPVPQAFQKDPEIKAWVDYLHMHLQDINVILDFGDSITNITNSESFETSSTSAEYQSHRRYLEQIEDVIPGTAQFHDQKRALEQIEDAIPTTRPKQFRPSVQTSDYSAINEDFIDAQNSSTITLIPSAGAEIITANGDGSTIKLYSTVEFHYNGQVSNWVEMSRQDTSIHWFLFESGTKQYWRAS